MPLVLQFIFQ